MQLGQGAHTNVYYWYEGDCSFISLDCYPRILGHFADGSTATVEGLGAGSYFGWNPP